MITHIEDALVIHAIHDLQQKVALKSSRKFNDDTHICDPLIIVMIKCTGEKNKFFS